MLFCPTCANILIVEERPERGLRYACNTCPYVYDIKKKVSYRTFPKLKVNNTKMLRHILSSSVIKIIHLLQHKRDLLIKFYLMYRN